jgi:hypothetical protein
MFFGSEWFFGSVTALILPTSAAAASHRWCGRPKAR